MANGQSRRVPARKYPVATTREGKRAVTAYVEPLVWKRLQLIALDEGTTMQDLLIEGINAVFSTRKIPNVGL